MKEYVLIFVELENQILLIQKNRPASQAGLFNLPGGKIENDESPEEAAIRELEEETGLKTDVVTYYGQITGSWGLIHCFSSKVDNLNLQPRDCETEIPSLHKWEDIKDSSKLMPNLRIVIPFFMSGLKDWILYDEGSNKNETITVAITIRR